MRSSIAFEKAIESGGALTEFACPGDRFGDQRFGGGHAVGQPDGDRFLGINAAAGEDQLLGARQSDAARQKVHAAAVGHEAALDEAHCECRMLGGNDEIAGERHVATEPSGGAIHGRDDNFRHAMQQRDALMRLALPPPAIKGHLPDRRLQSFPHAGNIASGTERFALAGQDDRAHALVGGDSLKHGDELGA